MVLRIEYLLFLGLVLLLLIILGINPSSQSAINPIGEKEILFQNFSLLELKEESIGQELSAKETIKYKTHLDFEDINFSNENGDNIQAKKGLYKNDIIYMNDSIRLTRSDGLVFITEKLNYNLKTKEVYSTEIFTLELNGSKIKGKKLNFSLNSKEISADNIEATIYLSP